MTVEPQKWDSTFFNRSIGRINTGEILTEQSLRSLSSKGFDTIYLFSDIEQPAVPSLGFPLVDEKVIWEQTLRESNSLSSLDCFRPKEKSLPLLNLFCESGTHSRFKLDPIFADDFLRFYETWLTNAIDGTYDDHILCTGTPMAPSGVITLKMSNAELAISIIAVSIGHRGQGIGRNLIEKAKTIAIENGIHKLSVATQAANESAMKFYAKTNFSIRSREYIYHLHFPIVVPK